MSYNPADFASPLTRCSGCQERATTMDMREDDNEDLLCVSCFDDFAEQSEDFSLCEECDQHTHKNQLVPVPGPSTLCEACAKCLLPDFDVRPMQPQYYGAAA